MTPYHSDPWLTVWQGDCREVMAQMEPESVHCVVTSPPYWGLRDYGTATWLGGDEGCDHKRRVTESTEHIKHGGYADAFRNGSSASNHREEPAGRHICPYCGAIRQDSQLGLEPTPEEYVANMVAVFREVRRVLRKDGTCWVNLGDSYWNGGAEKRDGGHDFVDGGKPKLEAAKGALLQMKSSTGLGLKPKDLVGIPWRVAFALQADGWYLRSDIIWAKPNPMPESVTDRPTKAHEYLFLLSKSARYYYDADAVREASTERPSGNVERFVAVDGERSRLNTHLGSSVPYEPNGTGRNLRSVWSIATQPYPGAHFATFPEALVEPCVKAGTSERGVCPECGAPWRRVVELTAEYRAFKEQMRTQDYSQVREGERGGRTNPATVPTMNRTTGWQHSCAHDLPPAPAVVLDPFAGSGTTGRVAQRLGRRAVLIDLNAEYLTQAMKRNADIPLGLEAS